MIVYSPVTQIADGTFVGNVLLIDEDGNTLQGCHHRSKAKNWEQAEREALAQVNWG